MFFSKRTALFTLVPLAIATECTQSNAIDWLFASAGSDACANYCGNDSACLQACYEKAQQGQCNVVGCEDKRATFECAIDKVGYRYTDDSLLCLNGDTVAFIRPNGSVTTNLGDGAAAATPTSEAPVATGDSHGTGFNTPTVLPTITSSGEASPSSTGTNDVGGGGGGGAGSKDGQLVPRVFLLRLFGKC
ncbi:hypothetical protein RRF57_010397 [Xylaria bambusicola]|uniref:Extracellular membrane protein CFEM domain-containing protein n=1 Tax=Xylaria bambusicola TaxID=326684 RepID=A0AAN7V3L5_9PEZI